jgi:HK97 family phage portal protein
MSLLRGIVRMITQGEWEEGYFNGRWFGTSLPASSGVTVTQETAMRMSAVYGCVRLLSDSVAGLPLQKFQKVNGERQQIPQDAWLMKPNKEYTRYRFWQETMTGLLLDGNAFSRLYRTSSGSVAAAWPLWPPSVQVDRDDEGNRRYRVGNEYFTDWEILHIHGLTLPGQLRGLSPVGDYVAKNAVGLGIAAEDYAAALFANGAMPGGWIEAPSCKTEEEAKRIKQRWKEQQANAHEPAVLSGDWKWHTEAFQPEATQLVQSRGFQVEEICRIYGVPPHMVASVERSTSWGTGIEQQGIQWVTYSLRPWLERIEQTVEPLLLPPIGAPKSAAVFCRFNAEGLLRGDLKSRLEAYEVGIRASIYTPNRCLAKEDEPPYEGGDVHYSQMNQYAIEQGRPQTSGQQ